MAGGLGVVLDLQRANTQVRAATEHFFVQRVAGLLVRERMLEAPHLLAQVGQLLAQRQRNFGHVGLRRQFQRLAPLA